MRIGSNRINTGGHRQTVSYRLVPNGTRYTMAFSANSRADAEDAFFTYCQRRGLEVFEIL